MLEDAQAQIMIASAATQELVAWFPGTLLVIEDYASSLDGGAGDTSAPPSSVGLLDLAYILFTSGSTGVPKGVMLTHANLLAYIHWHVVYYDLGPEDCVPHMAGLSFDASMAEIWPTLCTGGCVLPAPNDDIRLLPEALCGWYADSGATVAFLTTQLAEAVLSEPEFPANLRLRVLFTGGDRLHFGPPAYAPFKLVNIYGPTECTVNVTLCSVPVGSGPPLIGEPVPASQLYIVDNHMQPQPSGIFGELYIGGPQVGAGYLGKSCLTAERFVPNPFGSLHAPLDAGGPTLWPTGPCWDARVGPSAEEEPSIGLGFRSKSQAFARHSARLYKTGDCARWTEDGSVDFLGRADFQVKIRGQRIELGEIEAKLLQQDEVRECVVVCLELPKTRDKILAGYWSPKASGCITEAALRARLRDALPDYMIPQALIELPKLPVNANGKVDRRALPEPNFCLDEAGAAGMETASTDLETQLAAIFEQVLGHGPVPVGASFFQLGGHSLSVGQLVNKVRRQLHLKASLTDVYAAPSVRELAARLGTTDGVIPADEDVAMSEDAKDLPNVYHASFQQAALYTMAQLGAEASSALNLAFCCHVYGPLNVLRLRRAFTAVAMRHDALRSTFFAGSDGKLHCQVHDRDCVDFQETKEPPLDLGEWLLDAQYEVFELHEGPLSRVRVLAQTGTSGEAPNWILHWTLHHVSADLWSYNVLLDELATAYDQLESASEVVWEKPAPQYRGCVRQQQASLDSANGKRAMDYWVAKLDPAPPVLELPVDQRVKTQSFRGSKLDFEIKADLVAQLGHVASASGATSIYPVLLSAWMVLLSRHAQEQDVCVGAPMACRTTPESEAAVGYFVNPICIRATVAGSFESLVQTVSKDIQESLAHQHVPLAAACERLGLQEASLLQGMFVFQTSPSPKYAATLPSFFMGHAGAELPFGKDLRLQSLSFGQRHAQFLLALVLARGPSGELVGSFQYSTAVERRAVLALQAQYQRVLEAVVADPHQDVGAIRLLGVEEQRQLERRASTPWPRTLPTASLPELFVARAKANPSAFAVVAPEGIVTFGEALRSAEAVAFTLLSQPTGVERGHLLVGIMVGPGKWMVSGPLGAWLAGRGYFPLDAAHPVARIREMVEDAAPQCILCERRFESVARTIGCPTLVVEELGVAQRQSSTPRGWPLLQPDSPGLLVFTSGSTGRPKGVLLSIKALLTHVLFASEHFKFKPGQAVLQHTAWTFDAPMCEIWPALVAGATVVMSKRDGSKDFDYIAGLINEQHVTHALFVPSLLAEILEHQQLPRSLRSLLVVGEACSLSLARRILEAPLTLHNFYGPSEGGIGATIYQIDKIGVVPPTCQTLPIGRPVSWRQVLLLDTQLRPAVGRAGQIAIMGEGLALGYLGLPEETQRKFIPTPEAVREVLPQCGPVLYLTGDVGCYVRGDAEAEDLLEFVGRLDNQVKLRGQRIELGEVEKALLSAAAVTEAVAMVHGGEQLVAYFSTLHGANPSDAYTQCMEAIRQRLPRYMWPELMHIPEWPRGRTGKIDRKALPRPAASMQDAVGPRTPLEASLLEHFSKALRRDAATTSVHADFFALGGTSLKASSLLSVLRAQVAEAASLQFSDLYSHPSPSSLAAFLSTGREGMTLGPAPAEGLLPASLGQEHMLVLQELQPSSAAYSSPLLLRLSGPVDRDALATALEKLVARHDVLRSNLMRDTLDGEPCVVQVTTPASEFTFEMEYWHGVTQDVQGNIQGPTRAALRPQRGISRLAGRGGFRAGTAGGAGSFTSPIPSPQIGRPWAWSNARSRRASSAVTMTATLSSPPQAPPGMLASPNGFLGYASPGMRSPDLNPNPGARPLISRNDSAWDMSSTPSMDQQEEDGHSSLVMGWLVDEAKRPFDLRDESLVRVILARVAHDTHLLFINLHHAVTDGRSLAVLRHELSTAYVAAKAKQEPKLPEIRVQYADFAYWQREWMAQGQMDRQLAYWRRNLEGLQALQLPTDFPRPANLPLDGGQVSFTVPADLASRLRWLAMGAGSTLFAAMLGAYAAVLARFGCAGEVAVASVVANRAAPELEVLMGYFVNTVIFRVSLGGTFEHLLARLRETAAGAFEHAAAPYASVLEAARLDPTAVPAMFVFQDADDGRWTMGNVAVEEVPMPRTFALFDITCEVQEEPDGSGALRGLLVYNTNVWTRSRAERFRDSLRAFIAAVVAEPAVEMVTLPVLPETDHAQLLEWGGHTKPLRESAASCLEEFRLQLAKHSKRAALIYGDRSISYAEYGRRVIALADHIRRAIAGETHPEEEVVIAVLLARSVEMAVAVWAVLVAGAAYVPVDPDYPAERIAHILSNAEPKLLLCKEEHTALGGGLAALVVSAWPEPDTVPEAAITAFETEVPPERLAYVIYTSGSTGRPKGVAVEHRAVANMIREQIRLMGIQSNDRVLQFFKPAFDGAVQEYLSTPCAGAALVLWDSNESFGDVLQQRRVTVATMTPSALAALDEARLPKFEKVGVAAEACPPALVSQWAMTGRRLVNAYGPSEGCVLSTYAELQADAQPVPIGRPLENVRCYVFEPTKSKTLQPVGVSGELCIGGIQLARGYHNDPLKTAERFTANPLDGSRMYHSGDLVSWLPCGQLVYLGRNDEMVKIRGFRVELTEVEAALAACGAQSVAVGLSASKDALWAWVTPETLSPAELRTGVLRTLPQYMVPQRIFPLAQLPLTPNGKIDKVALLAAASAENTAAEGAEVPVPPQNPLEQRLWETVCGVLGVENVSVTADLKGSGMSSLKSVLLAQRLRDIHLAVPLGDLYELPTIRAIAEFVEREHAPGSFVVAVAGGAQTEGCHVRLGSCLAASLVAVLWLFLRLLVWTWIAGVVIWPAVFPLWLASRVVLPHLGLGYALAWVILAYPLYLFGVALLGIVTKWVLIGRYRAAVLPVDSMAFFRWWAVDRLLTFIGDSCLSVLRGGPLYYAYLRALGLRAKGYARIDTRFISEVDLITLGALCVVAEGAKLRPAVLEAGLLHLKPMVFGDSCAIGENAVCTSGCTTGACVTLQPLSLLSGRTARTLPDGSVWKGAPLVQSRQQPMRVPVGNLAKDLVGDLLALTISLVLIATCAAVAYCVFGVLAVAQGITWQWQSQREGWLFATVWLLYGPPVMASADVLLNLDMAKYADDTADTLGDTKWVFGLRIAGMIVVSFAAYGWALTVLSALLCRVIRGSRRRNSPLFQVRRLVLRVTFPRYPGQLSGTMGMALYLRLLGGGVALSATVHLAEPPLEPRKMHVGAGALLMGPLALGECWVRGRSLVGGGSVMLPHAEVEANAVVGAMSVVGRPVHSALQLVGNPAVVMRRAELGRPPATSPGRQWARALLRGCYPVLAPMILQAFLLVTLLPAMYALTVLMDMFVDVTGQGTILSILTLALALAPTYVVLGWCLALVAVIFKWLLLGRVPVGGRWQWYGSWRHHVLLFVQSLVGLANGILMSATFGTPLYNRWLNCLGVRVASSAVVMTPITEFDCIRIGEGAMVDKEAVISGQRMLAAKGGPSEFCVCMSSASVGDRSTISHAAVVAAADTLELSVLAPLSALGPSMRLPHRTLALGSPPQKFAWSKERDNLVKPSSRPVPRELRPVVVLPCFVARALSRMKVQPDAARPEQLMPLVTGASGFLGRFLVAALLEAVEARDGRVICLVRASSAVVARSRVLESLKKAGVPERHFARVEALAGDLSQRSLGLSYAEFQQLAGRATHVFNSAAKVNLTEPFELMRKDNVDATANLLEFCCAVRAKPFHHISTMGILTPDMLNRHGVIPESAPLGDMRALPLYGTGDGANGYPYSKWVAEAYVFEAARRGLPAFVHRPGLIGGHSTTGVLAEDVFFHFLSDVVKSRQLPAMEGSKFNLTPVDWVAKAIVHVGLQPGWTTDNGVAFHPAANGNTVTMDVLADVLAAAGYTGLQRVEFTTWRDRILAKPEEYKSWSFCASLSADGDGLDSMAGNTKGAQAMREAVGVEVFDGFNPRACLERMLTYCRESGLLQA